MLARQKPFTWVSLGAWIAVIVIGWAPQWAGYAGVGNTMLYHWKPQVAWMLPIELLVDAQAGMLSATILGVGQWLILRPVFAPSRRWGRRTALGAALGWTIGEFLL